MDERTGRYISCSTGLRRLLEGGSPLLLCAGGLAIGVHLFVIGYEEPALRRRFGDEYMAYRRHVRRWIPRLSRRG